MAKCTSKKYQTVILASNYRTLILHEKDEKHFDVLSAGFVRRLVVAYSLPGNARNVDVQVVQT